MVDSQHIHIEMISMIKNYRVPRSFIVHGLNEAIEFALVSNMFTQKQIKNIKANTCLRIVFVNPQKMRALNFQFRKKDKATDVLSFNQDEPGVMGELVVCPKYIAAQAQKIKISAPDELLFLLIHGFLHLLGYDHETNTKEAKQMFALQKQLFEHIRPAARGLGAGRFDIRPEN